MESNRLSRCEQVVVIVLAVIALTAMVVGLYVTGMAWLAEIIFGGSMPTPPGVERVFSLNAENVHVYRITNKETGAPEYAIGRLDPEKGTLNDAIVLTARRWRVLVAGIEQDFEIEIEKSMNIEIMRIRTEKIKENGA